MVRTKISRCALTIAGSDSGGGAGIQADLKVFAALGLHGASAVTCVTAQNPSGVRGIQAVRSSLVREQIRAILAGFRPAAAKTGMLYAREIIQTVADQLRQTKIPLVVDPVMVATSGAVLLRPSAIRELTSDLFPRATLVTPNLDEARIIVKRSISEPEQARAAAREIHERYGCAALVKGGHLRTPETAVDFFYDGRDEWMLEAPRVPGVSTHGTGCTYSAAIAGYLAQGETLARAVSSAKLLISRAIAQAWRCGRHSVLNPFA